MPDFTFTIPQEVADWILAEKNTQPQTFIENELVNPIIKDYEKSVGKGLREKADIDAKKQVAEAKKLIKLKEVKVEKQK